MTRKDYATLAACFARQRYAVTGNNATQKVAYLQWLFLRSAIMLELELDNPRFDRERFEAATEAD